MKTAFFTDKQFDTHTQAGHPEHAGRLQAVRKIIQENPIGQDLWYLSAPPATLDQIKLVHTAPYLDLLERTSRMEGPSNLGLDTYLVPESYTLAQQAVGGVIAVADAVWAGQADNGFAAVRPPGHHATPSMGMGFCLLSTVAIVAKHLVQQHGLQRVAIVDFDVHHGNGTQDSLYKDGNTLFISSHQSPLYPGTGQLHERGSGAGKNLTVNLPVPPHTGDQAFAKLYGEIVQPLLANYQPEIILVSAGFDAHWRDPLANLNLSLAGFQQIVQGLITSAAQSCAGKIVFVMEGGYDLTVLSHGWLNIAHALQGHDQLSDPLGKAPQDMPLDEHLFAKYGAFLR